MSGFRDPLVRGRVPMELLLTNVKNAENHGIRSLIRKVTSTAKRHARAAYPALVTEKEVVRALCASDVE